jgi:MFS family permease
MKRATTPIALTVTLCLAEIMSMTGFATFPALLPDFIGEWGLSNTDAGWINGIFFVGYLSSVPVLLSLTDRVPPRRVYLLCMALSGVVSLLFAFFAEGFWSALALRAVAGIGLAGTYMPGLKLLSDHLEGHRRHIPYYTSSFSIGAALSFVVAGEAAAGLDWRWAFGLSALGPALAVALILLVLPGKDPKPHAAPTTSLLDFRPVLRCRAAMGYVFAYTVHNFELFAMRSWIVAYLVFAQSLQPGAGAGWSATAIAAAVSLVGMPSSVIGNELAEKFGRARLITWVMLASATFAAVIGFVAAWPFWLIVVLLFAYGMAITADSGAITTGVIMAAPEGYRGATMAVHSCIGFMGSFAGPLAFGVALDLTGGGADVGSWGASFAFIGAVVLLGPILLAYGRGRAE